jgi:hypothetical protein
MTAVVCAWFALAAAPPFPWTATTAEASESRRGPFAATFNDSSLGIRRADVPLPPWPRAGHVILANGDRIAGSLDTADDRTVTIVGPAVVKGRIPLTAIAAIVVARPAGMPGDPLRSDWLGDRKSDAVRLVNGDTLTGTLDRIAKDGTSVTWRMPDRTRRTLDRADVAAVGFAKGLSRVRTPNAPLWHVVLADGSRITATKVAAVADRVTIDAVAGFTAVVKESELVAVDRINGPAMPLGDLKPKINETKPFAATAWPMQVNRSAKFEPLTLETELGTETFDRGLGSHPNGVLEYDVAGYRRFRAILGLDATTGRNGMAKVTVAVDGSASTFELTAATGAIRIERDLTGAKRLTLTVATGPTGERNADVNWADAILVK